MLEKQAFAGRCWWGWIARAVIVAPVGWSAWHLWPRRDAEITVVAAAPAPAVMAPAVVAPPAPPTRPAVGHTCPKDVDAIGAPYTADDHREREYASDGAVSKTGCTIAVWSDRTMNVSWDGGQSFAKVEAPGLGSITVGDGRVLALRDDRMLGILTPDAGWTWRPAPGPAGATLELAGAGRYTVVLAQTWRERKGRPALPVSATLVFSTDEGEHWQSLPAPVKGSGTIHVEPAGRVVLVDNALPPPYPFAAGNVDPDPAEAAHAAWFAESQKHTTLASWTTELTRPRWRRMPADHAWTYQFVEEYTGNHFTEGHLEATRDGLSWNLSGSVPTHNEAPSLAGHFAMMQGTLLGLEDGHTVALPGTQPAYDNYRCRLIGEDAYGSAIVLRGELVRWSPRGGWRILL